MIINEDIRKIKSANQLGIAVKSVDETAAFLEHAFGIKCTIIPMPEAKAMLRGKEIHFRSKVGLARVGHVDIELIEILEGEHLVKEYFEEHGAGIHHIGLFIKDMENAKSDWEKNGSLIEQNIAYKSGLETAYLDTKDNLGNIVIELIKF